MGTAAAAAVQGDRCCESRKRRGAGTFKVPRSSNHARSACSSPPGCVSTRPGGGEEPARALHQDDLRAATRQGKQIKSSMLPAYCDPPNPCPLGYTAQDGCIEDFENNSEFSQKYQAS